MSDYTPTIVESLGNEIARVRKGQNITAGDLAQRLGPWLSNLLAEKQAEALQLAAKAIQGRVDPKATHRAVHVNAGLLLACDELSDQAQRLREQAANQEQERVMSEEWFQRPRRWGATNSPPWHLVAERSRLSSLRIAECGVDTYHAHERAIIASEPGGNVCRTCWAAFRRTLSPDQDQPDRSTT